MKVEPITLLVADDNYAFAQALIEHLREEKRIEVVGRAANGAQAVELVEALRPQVVSMDLDMPVLDGIEATRAILARYPETHIVIVSGSAYTGEREAARELGAAAVIPKSRVYAELIETVFALERR